MELPRVGPAEVEADRLRPEAPVRVREELELRGRQVEALEGLPLPQAESVPGVKRWNLTLKPQQETTLESGYQVRYPYQRHVDGL